MQEPPPEEDPVDKSDVEYNMYKSYLQKKSEELEKKTGGKVLVEDDFIEPGDFRDRSLNQKSSKGKDSGPFNSGSVGHNSKDNSLDVVKQNSNG